jgi:hypothetical protein
MPLSNLIKIRPLVAELFHAGGRADGRTDRHDEATSFFGHVYWAVRIASLNMISVSFELYSTESVFSPTLSKSWHRVREWL